MDENIIFITLIVILSVFIVQKYPRLVAIVILVILGYIIFKSRFTNPRDLINYVSSKIMETFEPCSINNQVYCGDTVGSNMTILPDFLRTGPIGSNTINNMSKITLKPEDYQIDKRLKMGIKQITLDDIIQTIPPLLDYKIYLDKVIKFTLQITTDNVIQKDFLARKLRFKIIHIFYNAYNTITDKSYPLQSYNKLLYSEREFDDTLNIFVFLGMNDNDNYKLSLLQKEFKELNKKLNQFIIDKINDISPNDYDITTSRLPEQNEPLGFDLYSGSNW
jgi:hypothetical protein